MARVGPALGMPHAERASAGSPIAWIVRQLEAEQERWFLWLPVMFGAGIALYFLLPEEPWAVVALLPVVAALAVHLTVARGAIAALMTGALLATALGIAAAKLRTEAVRAPVLQKQVGPVDVYGFVELVEPRASKGQRVTIRVTALEKHEPQEWPTRVRVRTMTETPGLEPGDAIRLKATLSPPPGPALPGDYDFARAAWFQALGAVGYATAAPELVTSAVAPPLGLRASAAVARLRQAIGRRVVEALPGQTGAIANALITGKQRRA
jgi:competence protein ComEC